MALGADGPSTGGDTGATAWASTPESGRCVGGEGEAQEGLDGVEGEVEVVGVEGEGGAKGGDAPSHVFDGPAVSRGVASDASPCGVMSV